MPEEQDGLIQEKNASTEKSINLSSYESRQSMLQLLETDPKIGKERLLANLRGTIAETEAILRETYHIPEESIEERRTLDREYAEKCMRADAFLGRVRKEMPEYADIIGETFDRYEEAYIDSSVSINEGIELYVASYLRSAGVSEQMQGAKPISMVLNEYQTDNVLATAYALCPDEDIRDAYDSAWPPFPNNVRQMRGNLAKIEDKTKITDILQQIQAEETPSSSTQS